MSRLLTSAADLEQRVLELGFLPFFRNSIAGFSVEEMCEPSLWFNGETEGPWEWKGPVVRGRRCAYGKFFGSKAMYVSMEFFADFCRWKRAAHPLEGLDGGAAVTPRTVYDTVVEHEAIVSPELKRLFGALPSRKRMASDLVDLTGLGDTDYKHRRSALERSLTALQGGTHLCIADFVYPVSRAGSRYGWGWAQYSTPEALYGTEFLSESRGSTPVESYRLLTAHLGRILPEAGERRIASLLR